MENRRLKVVLADDEVPILEDLKAFPFSRHGFHVVGEARSGKEALSLCRRLTPDILITDILMPEMDGIELARRLRGQYPAMQILFITLYRDFDYAREAMHWGVREYLLKGVYTEADLANALQRAREELDRRPAHASDGGGIPTGAFLDFLEGGSDGGDLSDALPFPLAPGVARIHYGSRTNWAARTQALDAAVGAFCADGVEAVRLGPHEAFLPCAAGRGGCGRERLLAAIRTVERGQIAGRPSLSVAVAPPVDNLPDCRTAVVRCRQSATAGFYAVRGEVLDAAGRGFRALRPEERREFARQARLRSADADALAAYLRRELAPLAAAERIAPDDVRDLFSDWRADFGHGATAAPEDGDGQLHLQGLIGELVALLRSRGDGRAVGRLEVEQAAAYVRDHLRDPIQLRAVARMVGLSPNYFGSVFRAQMGEGFKTYVNRMRMETAALYLRTTNMKVYEIAERVGIGNYRYFTELFHGHFGRTTQDYRMVRR